LHNKSDWQKVAKIFVQMYALILESKSGYQVTLEIYSREPVKRDPVIENPKVALKHQNSKSKRCDKAGMLFKKMMKSMTTSITHSTLHGCHIRNTRVRKAKANAILILNHGFPFLVMPPQMENTHYCLE
jgi:hypothetical protein